MSEEKGDCFSILSEPRGSVNAHSPMSCPAPRGRLCAEIRRGVNTFGNSWRWIPTGREVNGMPQARGLIDGLGNETVIGGKNCDTVCHSGGNSVPAHLVCRATGWRSYSQTL